MSTIPQDIKRYFGPQNGMTKLQFVIAILLGIPRTLVEKWFAIRGDVYEYWQEQEWFDDNKSEAVKIIQEQNIAHYSQISEMPDLQFCGAKATSTIFEEA